MDDSHHSEVLVGDSYRYELSKRRGASGRQVTRPVGFTRTEETGTKQAAVKEVSRKKAARQIKLWL